MDDSSNPAEAAYSSGLRHDHCAALEHSENIPPGTQSRSVIKAPVGEHSAKSECLLELIEGYFPTLPKIELNRRGPPCVGWDAWGNEVVAAFAIGAALPRSQRDDGDA